MRPLLLHARRRGKVKSVVADGGYDSEENHCIARQEMKVRSIIPPTSGRPSARPPPTRHRRNMYHRFKRKADQKLYGQRWQAETVNSMIKRNLGSALRARTARRRSCELMLRVVTHNLMIFRRVSRGSRQSTSDPLYASKSRVGIRIEPEASDIKYEGNQIDGFATPISDLRKG